MDTEELRREFDPKYHKTTNFGRKRTYVEVPHYIDRLNRAFDHQWSWEIIDERIGEVEIVVRGRLIAEGIVKEAYGCKRVTISKSGEVVSIGDDTKAAASDALKKAASLFGLGLSIHTELEAEEDETAASEPRPPASSSSRPPAPPPAEPPAERPGEPPVSERITEQQLQTIAEIAKALRVRPDQVAARAIERYKRPTPKLSRHEAEDLIRSMRVALGRAQDEAAA